MSLVYITYHNENIHNIEDHSLDIEMLKHSLGKYHSKFSKDIRTKCKKRDVIEQPDGHKLLTSSLKSGHKTMGYAETPLNPPCAFLKKNQGIKWRRLNEHVCVKGRAMPEVPRFPHPKEKADQKSGADTGDDFVKKHKHRANFINVNVERMKNCKTKRPPPRYVDTPNGERHNLINSGLIPQYVCSKRYGKVPCYLEVHKKMLQEMRERCEMEEKDKETLCMRYVHQDTVRALTPQERQEILLGLKANFAEIFKVYQKMPIYTDTVAKKLRKGKLETDLRQIEQDIFLMESNPVIYVSQY